ncbi:MAG: hypothetical protein VST66_11205 [Nitrospirota bacterium]|nr:hypothetical protein [Nitrospirota bacterium]
MKTLKGDKSEVEKGWYSRGLIRSLWIDHACQVGGNDLHGTDELFMALAGELELEIEGRQFQQKNCGKNSYSCSSSPSRH